MAFRPLFLLLVLFTCLPAAAGELKGLWLLPRKDAQNTARADLQAFMPTAPGEVWRFGGDPDNFSAIFPVTLNGTRTYLTQAYSTLQLRQPGGTIVWKQPKLGVSSILAVDDFAGDGSLNALLLLGTSDLALLDLQTGKPRWTWTAPAGSNLSSTALWKIWRHRGQARLIIFPQNTLRGICLDLVQHGDKPAIVWDREYPNTYWKGFGPQIVLADMDRDGIPDVVLAGKPGYAAVIDAVSGAVKFDVHYQVTNGHDEGRPYGLLQAADLDRDGFPDIVMVSCQVEEYISIIHNEAGKSLRPIWSIFLEHDLPEDKLELRPQVTSVMDLDGDGRRELVLGLFNVTGDRQWHTMVIDPMKGFDARRADLPGRYFWGCYDLAATGRPFIVTSTEPLRKTAASTTLQAVDGRTFKDIETVADAALAINGSGPLPDDRGFMAIRNTPITYDAADHATGLLLSHRGSAPSVLWSIREGRSQFEPCPLTTHASLMAASTGATHPARDLSLSKSPPTVLARDALVAANHGRRELVMALSDNTVLVGEPDLARSGEFKSALHVPGAMPAAWLSPDGNLTLVTAPDNSTVRFCQPFTSGDKPVTVHLPHPLYRTSTTRSGPTMLPFGTDAMRVYTGLQTGVHTLASAMYDAAGKALWIDEKEGPYPRVAAVMAGNGPSDSLVIDNHGKHLIYSLAGTSRLIAHGWNETIPGRGDGAKYVVPIVGPFGPAGETRLLMSSGLQSVETLDAAGKRLAKHDFASVYEFEWNSSSVAQLRGPAGPWDLLMVNRDGILHCFDIGTCLPRWTYDLHCKATIPISIVTADLDADGKDDLLIGLPNGTLFAFTEHDAKPAILWHLDLDHGIRDTIVADVDGDGKAEVIVETEDGCIHILKAR
jgi:hypothetical protein